MPLHDRLESGLGDRMQHLATGDPEETEERRREHVEHQEIQLYVINAQRAAAIALRDAGEINDATLRELERELDLEELGWRPEGTLRRRRRLGGEEEQPMGRRAPATAMVVLAAAVVACAPVATPAPTPAAEPPASALAFPRTTGEVVAGRYDSHPPFNVPFTFDVPAGGWRIRCTSTASSSTSAGSPPRSAKRLPSAGSPSVTPHIRGDERARCRTHPGSAATLLHRART